MSLDLGSAWSSPRRTKLIALTVLGLLLLLLVPLYQLSDHDASGIYRHLTKYLGHDAIHHDGPASTDLHHSATSTADVIAEVTNAIDENLKSDNEEPKTDAGDESKPDDDKPQEPEEKLEVDVPPSEKTEEAEQPEATDKPADENAESGENKAEEEHKSEEENKTEEENKPEEDNKSDEHEEPYESPNEDSVYPTSRKSPCDGFPQLRNITLVMKTGATEAFDKLPTQLLTGLQCLDDFLLFSDLEQTVGNYHVMDVLADVKDEVKQGLMEFDLYNAQANCPVSQDDCTSEMDGGWELDKYKFLHMIEKTWAMRPGKKWYVFAEADSYVFWPNLIYWLENKVTPDKHPYVGSVALLKNMPFAHGGSGYVISGETVKMMAATPDLAHKYDAMAPHECCGDYLMALAVNDTGSLVKQAHPMFNGEKPNTLPYGHGHWCEPLLTMHHMNSEEVSSAWHYEQTRNKTGILQIKEMYHAFMAPNLVSEREQYDNLSDDECFIAPDEQAQSEASDHEKNRQKAEDNKNPTERQAHLSPEHCSKVCVAERLDIAQDLYDAMDNDSERFALLRSKYEERAQDKDWNKDRRCFQWRYHKNTCCIARSFKLGKPRKEDKVEDRWTSGWFVDGINNWIDAKGECQPEWKNID